MPTPTEPTEPFFELLNSIPKAAKVPKANDTEKRRVIGKAEVATLAPWETIVVGNDNIRDAAATDIVDLAESIRLVGLLTPLTVEPYGEGQWLLAAGHRRYLALAALGFKKGDVVPIHPLEAHDEAYTRTTRMLHENTHRQGLSPMEEAELIERLTVLHGMSQVDVAKHLGWNRTTVAGRLALLKLPPDARDMVANGTLQVELAQKLGQVVKAGATKAQIEATLDKARNGFLTEGSIQHLAQSIRASKKAETLRARLKARGVTVVVNLSRVDVPEGHVAACVDVLDLPTAAAVRELDLDKLKTLRYEEGRPVLFIDKRWDGEAVAWTVVSKQQMKAGFAAPSTWEVRRVVQDARRAQRRKWLADAELPSDKDLLALAAATLLQDLHFAEFSKVAKLLGLELAEGSKDEDPSYDRGVQRQADTIRAWLTDATGAKLKAIVFLVSGWLAAAQINDTVNGDGDKGETWLAEAFLAAGMPGAMPAKEWAASLDAAAEKLAAAKGATDAK